MTHLRFAVACVFCLLLAIPSNAQETKLTKVQEELRREFLKKLYVAEALYENLDVTVQETLFLNLEGRSDQKLAFFENIDAVVYRTETSHYLNQNGLVLFEKESESTVLGESEPHHYSELSSYDGKRTVFLHGENAVFAKGKHQRLQHFRPHILWLARHTNLRHRLSPVIDGTNKSLWTFQDRVIDITSIARIQRDNESLIQFRFEFIELRSHQFVGGWEVEFPESKNCLPVSARSFNQDDSRKIHVEEVVIDRFTEIEPGIFFPWSICRHLP